MPKQEIKRNPVKEKIHEIIFEADTFYGKFFDVSLLIVIVASILVVMLESIEPLSRQYLAVFQILEWTFTIIFTVEYLLRLYCVYRPWKYASSFYGIVDLLAILPTYLALLISGSQYFIIIRGLRLLRIFRIFKLGHFMVEGRILMAAINASKAKITVFLIFVVLMITIIGALMYLIEGGKNPSFSSIPRSMYWAVVTLTTVGYGDITPQTNLGQFLSAVVMIMGYAVLAVPTGIVSAEIINSDAIKNKTNNTESCRYCGREGHDDDAVYCKYCGEALNPA
jgi:voltage-gated potassium channel